MYTVVEEMTDSSNTLLADAAIEPLRASSLVLRLSLVRLKLRWISAAHGTALLVMAGLGLLLAGMLLDWSLGLPVWARTIVLGFDFVILAALVWRWVILPVRRAPDSNAVALMIEDAYPELGSRLISAVQLARPNGLPPGASRAIAGKMIEQTIELSQSIRFNAVAKADRLHRVLIFAMITLTIFAGLCLYGRPVSGQLLARAFLADIPVPYFTDVEVLTGDRVVARGSTIQFRAIARRMIPSSGYVQLQYASGRTQRINIDRTDQPAPGGALFVRELADLQESFDYRVKLNDNLSPAHHIDVQPPPAVSTMLFQVKYPPYTHRGPEFQPAESLTILRGSTLRAQLTATKKLKSGSISLVGSNLTLPLQVDSANPTMAGADVPLTDDAHGLTVQLTDTFDLPSGDSVIYPLKIVPDRPPTVAITFPKKKEDLVTRKAKYPIRFEAGDDFGVDAISLQYRVDGGQIATIPLEINRGQLAITGQYVLDIAGIPIPAGKSELTGSTIEYWLSAKDANDVTGPGVSETEHFALKAVTEDQKRAQLAEEESQIIGNFGSTAAEQKGVTNDVGDMVHGQK
jgi:hypothetical protein